jgi:hypothetical protein
MFRHYIILLFFTFSQSTIYIGIIDDNDYPKGILTIPISNITFCNQKGLILLIQWINSSNSLPNLINRLESRENQTNIYITHKAKFSTKLIEDFCKTNRIPFITMSSYGSLTTFVV